MSATKKNPQGPGEIEGVCTGCTECSDRDTCECNFDEDLAFEAAADQDPAENLHPRAVAKRA